MAESNRTERRLLDSIRKAKTGPDDDTADKASTPAPKTNRAVTPAEGATTSKRAAGRTRSSSAKSSPAKSSPSGPAAERPDTGLAGGRSEDRPRRSAGPQPARPRHQKRQLRRQQAWIATKAAGASGPIESGGIRRLLAITLICARPTRDFPNAGFPVYSRHRNQQRLTASAQPSPTQAGGTL